MSKKIVLFLLLLLIPHVLLLIFNFIVCDELVCLLVPGYILTTGVFYTFLILILLKFTARDLRYYLFFLSIIYIYPGLGLATEGGFGYRYLVDFSLRIIGCTKNYAGFCDIAEQISFFFSPIALLLLGAFLLILVEKIYQKNH